jgi:hypothetical protein
MTLVPINEVELRPLRLVLGWGLSREYRNQRVRGWGIVRHLIADGLDIQKAKDPLMPPHAQHFHSACTSWVRRQEATTPSVGPND